MQVYNFRIVNRLSRQFRECLVYALFVLFSYLLAGIFLVYTIYRMCSIYALNQEK